MVMKNMSGVMLYLNRNIVYISVVIRDSAGNDLALYI